MLLVHWRWIKKFCYCALILNFNLNLNFYFDVVVDQWGGEW